MAARRAKKKKQELIDGIEAIDFDALDDAAEDIAEDVAEPEPKRTRPKSKAARSVAKGKGARKSARPKSKAARVPSKAARATGNKKRGRAAAEPADDPPSRTRTRARKRDGEDLRRPSRQEGARRTSRGQRRPSGAARAQSGKPPWLIPAAALGVLAIVIIGAVLASGGGDDGKGSETVVKTTRGDSGGSGSAAAGSSQGGIPAGKEALYEEMAASLANAEAQTGDPEPALRSIRQILLETRQEGFNDLVARAEKTRKKLEAELSAMHQAEFDSRKKLIDEQLAGVAEDPGKLLQAEDELSVAEDHFTGREGVPKGVLTSIQALKKDVAGKLKTAVDSMLGKIEAQLEKGKWADARELIADLAYYGEKGEELSLDLEEKLADRKRVFYAEKLAQIRRERRAKSASRLSKARSTVKARREKFERTLKARTAKAQEATKSRALSSVALRDKSLIRSCRIDRIGENSVTLSGIYKNKSIKARKFDWNFLAPDSRIKLTQLMLTDDDAAGYFELGKYCIIHEKYDLAETSFEKAVAIDSTLKKAVPNVAEFRKPITYSKGEESWKGDRMKIAYNFDDESQIDDFGIKGESLKIEKGQLMARVRTLRSLGGSFDYQVPLQYQIVPGTLPAGGYFVLEIDYADKSSRTGGGSFGLLLGDGGKKYAKMDRGSAAIRILLLGERAIEDLEFQPVKEKSLRITVLADKDKLNVVLGEKTMFAAAGDITGVSLTLTGYSRNRKAMIGIDELVFEGRMNKEKVKRVIKERKARRVRKLHTRLDKKSDDDVVPKIPKEHVEALNATEHMRWKMMIESLQQYMKGEVGRDTVKARCEDFRSENEEVAGFYFYRGYFRMMSGKYGEALADYDKAVEMDKGFAEPFVWKAQCLTWHNRHAKAQEALEQAFALQPDHPYGRALEARLTFYKGGTERPKALGQIEVARELDPGNGEISTQFERLKAVLQGPPWPDGKPEPVESKHFIVHTDLAPKHAKLFLDTLERIQLQFQSHFPMRDVEQKRKGVCYVFATRATYQIYRELTLGSRGENSLGYYHPGFKDIHLFETEGDDIAKIARGEHSETLDTLHHEAWHQYIDRLIPALPRWVDEGLAEYFGSMTWEDGKVVHNLNNRIPYLHNYKKSGDTMKFADLMKTTAAEFMRYDVGYGHSWSIVHMCFVKKPEKYKATLMRYLEDIRAGKSRELAFQESFGKIDLDEMERDWSAMLDQMAIDYKKLKKK